MYICIYIYIYYNLFVICSIPLVGMLQRAWLHKSVGGRPIALCKREKRGATYAALENAPEHSCAAHNVSDRSVDRCCGRLQCKHDSEVHKSGHMAKRHSVET